jgi:hypothetical protein
MAKGKTKLEKMSKDERTSLAYALATNLAKHGKPQTPKNERKLTKGEENKKEDHVMKFKDTFDLKELMDFNDPVLVKQRADKMEREKVANAPKSTPKKSINPNYAAIKNAPKIKFLEKEKAQLMRDMEQEAEPEGGSIANEYGRKLNRIDNAIAKLRKS